jgi:hypothetical protein
MQPEAGAGGGIPVGRYGGTGLFKVSPGLDDPENNFFGTCYKKFKISLKNFAAKSAQTFFISSRGHCAGFFGVRDYSTICFVWNLGRTFSE